MKRAQGRDAARVWRVWALMAMLTVIGAAPARAEHDHPPPRTITVSGYATLTVPNDLARLGFAVEARAPSSSAALSAAAVRARRLIARMLAEGIAPADVTTGSIEARRSTPEEGKRRTGPVVYIASVRVRVVVRDVSRTGRIAAAAVAAGAADVDGPHFTATRFEEATHRALASAYADAYEKARRLAHSAGLNLGRLLDLTEERTEGPEAAGGEEPSSGDTATPVPPPVRPGRSTVSAEVTAIFELN